MSTPKEEINALFVKWDDLVKVAKKIYGKLEGDVSQANIDKIKDKMQDFETNEARCRTLLQGISNSGFLKEAPEVDTWPANRQDVHDKVQELSGLTGGMHSVLKECLEILGVTV
ncbi:hypothetical protein F5Y06DRAFT_301355 [Hypoxylon sp. FL0890]|nr:hypothetical protein F5Y06DRAFT_301355 [Hypoxylon sp. FL0890]